MGSAGLTAVKFTWGSCLAEGCRPRMVGRACITGDDRTGVADRLLAIPPPCTIIGPAGAGWPTPAGAQRCGAATMLPWLLPPCCGAMVTGTGTPCTALTGPAAAWPPGARAAPAPGRDERLAEFCRAGTCECCWTRTFGLALAVCRLAGGLPPLQASARPPSAAGACEPEFQGPVAGGTAESIGCCIGSGLAARITLSWCSFDTGARRGGDASRLGGVDERTVDCCDRLHATAAFSSRETAPSWLLSM
mmetsp:Transcript_15127/g.45328  ORF Transcript_15127/g.45328 Transcript_15127/m.45328 type:complete len:248 (-) Transcript_15127:2392-3135(-)